MDVPEVDAQSSMDFSRIRETSDGDTDFERELFGVFIEDCEDRLTRLRTAISEHRLTDAQREAHTIKGAAANVGTTRLQEIARSIEGLNGASMGSGEELLEQLEAEFLRVKIAIEGYLATL